MALDVLKVLRAASDSTRLRILGLVASEPLSVGEIEEILGMGQSRISRHLKILADASILESRRAGSRIYYGMNPESAPNPVVRATLESLSDMARTSNTGNGLQGEILGDARKLREILELRKQVTLDHFQNLGADEAQRQERFVDSFFYRKQIEKFAGARPGVTVDLGCGTGELLAIFAGVAERVVGVDQSARVLAQARRLVPTGDFRLGEVEHLPVANAEADTVVASMVLHHLPEPMIGIKEAGRILKKGGHLIIADLGEHDEDAMQKEFADFWPGFPHAKLEQMIKDGGFTIVEKKTGKGKAELTSLIYKAKKQKED